MEIMDKGLTVQKWVLINWPNIPQMPQNLSAQIVCPNPKVWDLDEKKASLGVRCLWLPSLVYCGKVLTFSLSVCLHFAIGDCKYFLEFFFAFHILSRNFFIKWWSKRTFSRSLTCIKQCQLTKQITTCTKYVLTCCSMSQIVKTFQLVEVCSLLIENIAAI